MTMANGCGVDDQSRPDRELKPLMLVRFISAIKTPTSERPGSEASPSPPFTCFATETPQQPLAMLRFKDGPNFKPPELLKLPNRESHIQTAHKNRLPAQRIGKSNASLKILPQLDIPVRDVDEMFPALVTADTDLDFNEGPPLGLLGTGDEPHPRFPGCPVGLACVARDA